MKTYFSLKNILSFPAGQPSASKKECIKTPRDVLLADITKTQRALETAYCGFDNVTDPDLIDCYIYEIDSALKRYRFLLQQAQHMQLYEQYTSCNAFDSYEEDIHEDIIPAIPAIPYSLSLYHN